MAKFILKLIESHISLNFGVKKFFFITFLCYRYVTLFLIYLSCFHVNSNIHFVHQQNYLHKIYFIFNFTYLSYFHFNSKIYFISTKSLIKIFFIFIFIFIYLSYFHFIVLKHIII